MQPVSTVHRYRLFGNEIWCIDVNTGHIFPNEAQFEWNNIRGLTYLRRGNDSYPFLVCLPGGVHLARIFYGDPHSRRSDFLDYWLDAKGFGMLALSYPTDHPAIGIPSPDLTIAAWAEWIATVTSETLRETPNRPVAVAMWSMAGRSVAAVNNALTAHGINATCFLSLAASPPLPGVNYVAPGGDPLTPEGLWEGGIYIDGFAPSLTHQDQLNDHQIIDRNLYLNHYRCNTPVMLRGTPQRYGSAGSYWSHDEAHRDTRASTFSDFPITATISPTDSSDSKHVLCDRVNWNFYNLQRIHAQAQEIGLESIQWSKLRAFAEELPLRLSRNVEGGHFFFVGERGAESTASHCVELIAAVDNIRGQLDDILGTDSVQTRARASADCHIHTRTEHR